MRPGSRPRDLHAEALMDAERSSLDRPEDLHMAALMGGDEAVLPQGPLPVEDPERDRYIEEHVPEELAGDEALTARMLDEYRRRGGR